MRTPLLTRKELMERLTTSVVDVYFTKVNGQNRKMTCTLLPSEIPGGAITDNARYLPQDSGVINVFDVELQDWRSFLIENVHATITPTLGEVRTDGSVSL